MTEKTIKMNIPTIGDVEFNSDAEFVKFLKELNELRTLEELRAKASYDDEFWGGDDCE